MRIFSFSPFGYEGLLVAVEVDLRRGIPAVDMVGLADGAVRESRERMRSAILNSQLDFPLERVLISLSPADMKKEGAGFDLAVALAVLSRSAKEQEFADAAVLVMGELELSGRIRGVRGVHAAAATAAEQGIGFCIIPAANKAEAEAVRGMRVFPAEHLKEAFDIICCPDNFCRGAIPSAGEGDCEVCFPPLSAALDFSEVRGQGFLVRALQIAAAGAHNLIAYGPPGCGKTLSLERFPGLLPLLTEEESIPVARIYSLAGLNAASESFRREAPFRVPHQSASVAGMTGGGEHCGPGEISLAHNGALFLDEAAEFKSAVLQSLRVPLESGCITLSRAGRSTTYPARFQLLIASNPCPCGNYGAQGKICLCGARVVEQYWKKFSAPLLDRIDIRVPLFTPPADLSSSVSTAELRRDIARAVGIQRRRRSERMSRLSSDRNSCLSSDQNSRLDNDRNSRLSNEDMGHICIMTDEARHSLADVSRMGGLSLRGTAGCIKIARTIADMEGEELIHSAHIEEAFLFRRNEGGVSLCF